jgi:hypothetical protein
MQRFKSTRVSLSIRGTDGAPTRVEVDGMAIANLPELVVTKGYQTRAGIWHVTHAPTGLSVTRSLGTQRAAKAVASDLASVLLPAGVRLDTDDAHEAVRRFRSVPTAMEIINAVRG